MAGRVAAWAAVPLCFLLGGVGTITFLGGPAQAQQTGRGVQSAQPAEIWYGNKRVDAAFVGERVKPTDGSSEPDEQAIRDMLVQARHLARHGDMDDALRLIRLAANYPIQWDNDKELTPESLLKELQAMPGGLSHRGSSLPGPLVLEMDPPRSRPPDGLNAADGQPGTSDKSIAKENAKPPLGNDEKSHETDSATQAEVPGPRAHDVPASLSVSGAAAVPPTDSASPAAGGTASPEPAGVLRRLEADTCRPASCEVAVPRPTVPQVVLATMGEDGVAGRQSLSRSQTFSLVGFIGGLLLCPVVVALVAFFALGRVASGKGFALRVHVVNDPKQGCSDAVSTPPSQPSHATTSGGGGTVVDLQKLDVPLALDVGGGTFDEKRQKEEEAARKKRQTLVKQLFEDNLSLRQELHDLQPAVA